MSSRRQIILSLKQKTDLTFLDKLNEKTHDSAYDIYLELQDLKDNKKVNIPETLLSKINTLLQNYNDEILHLIESDKILKNTTELLRKETQTRIHFEENHKTQLRNNETLTTEIEQEKQTIQRLDEELKNSDHIISKLKGEVNALKQAAQIQPPPVSQERVSTEPDAATAEVSNTAAAAAVGSSAPSVLDETVVIPSHPPPPRPESDTQQQNNPSTHAQSSSPPPKIRNIFVVGDSHTRDLKSIMISKLPEQCYIRSYVKPGKCIKYLVDNIKPNLIIPGTQVIFFAGTNDVFKTSWSDIKSSLDKLHNKLSDFQVMFILIPPRYDTWKINNHISRLNSLIKHHIVNFPNFTYFNPAPIVPISSFSHDLIHMDRKGKHLLCNQLIMKLFNKIAQVDSRASLGHNRRYDDRNTDTYSNTHRQALKYTGPNHTPRDFNTEASTKSSKVVNIPSLLSINVNPYRPPIYSAPPPPLSRDRYSTHVRRTYSNVLKPMNSISFATPHTPCTCYRNPRPSNLTQSTPSATHQTQTFTSTSSSNTIPNNNRPNRTNRPSNIPPPNFPYILTTLV